MQLLARWWNSLRVGGTSCALVKVVIGKRRIRHTSAMPGERKHKSLRWSQLCSLPFSSTGKHQEFNPASSQKNQDQGNFLPGGNFFLKAPCILYCSGPQVKRLVRQGWSMLSKLNKPMKLGWQGISSKRGWSRRL